MNRRRALLATLASFVTTAAAALLPGGSAQAVPNDDWFRITNDHGYVLSAWTINNGTRTVQDFRVPDDLDRPPRQREEWRKVADSGFFRFRNADTDKQYALTVNSAVDWVNKPVNVYTNTPGDPDQLWRAIPIPGTNPVRYELKNPKSDKCLGAVGDVDLQVQPMYVLACNKNMKSQRWWFDNRS